MSRYRNYNADYKTSELGFPSVFTPESEKTDKYHMEWSKAIYSQWYNGGCAYSNDYASKNIRVLRSYGQGSQDVSQYLKQEGLRSSSSTASDADPSSVNDKKWLFDGMNNIDTKVISVAPKVKSMLKSYLMNIVEDVVVECIDPLSGQKKDKEKYKLYLYSKHKDFIDGYMKRAGLSVDEPTFLPEDLNELEMYDKAGGFKAIEASVMEKLVQYSLELSGYEHDLELDIYDDLIDLGIAATKKKLDPEDLKFKDVYIDPEYLVVQRSDHNDFRDIDWVGHVEFYSLSQLMVFMPWLTEDDIRQIAYSYKGLLGNDSNFSKRSSTVRSGDAGEFSTWKIAVFEAEWKDSERREGMFYDNSRGKTSELPVNAGTKSKIGGNQRYVQSNLQKLRQCSWVIGTEYVFDWGTVNMQDRPAKNKSISNYHIRAVGDLSLMAQMMPVMDELMISYVRWQDARANAVKDGYAINLAKLKTIGQGDDKLNVWSVLQLWKTRGLLLYQDSIDGEYRGGKTLPIDRLPNTLLDEIQEFTLAWDHALKRLEDLTGINALMLGAAPDPNAPVTTQKLSVASSANAVKPLGVAMSDIKRKSAQSFMRRFITACKARKDIVDSYAGVVGKESIQSLLDASKSMVDYGMSFVVRPTDEQKMDIYKSVELSMQNRREGRPGIDLQTAMQVRAWLDEGVNLKWIRFYIGAMERKIFKQDQDAKKEMINLQADRNDRSAQIAAQAAAQEKQMDAQSKFGLQQQQNKDNLLQTLVSNDEEVAGNVARKLGLKKPPQTPINSPNAVIQPSSL